MIATSQGERYRDFYAKGRSLRWAFRFDVHYRVRRMHEVLVQLGLPVANLDVLDVGFGDGSMLASFPKSCSVTGVDVSQSGVDAAKRDPRFAHYRQARFEVVKDDDFDGLPQAQFDLLLSSHMLEHVSDDAAYLRAFYDRLRRGGHLLLFVPIEEPDYIHYHRRNYSLQSVAERVSQAGFDLRLVEGSMYVNGGIWKLLTIPSRRNWPVIKPLVDGLRMASLSALTYPGIRFADAQLYRLGLGARQAFVVARKP